MVDESKRTHHFFLLFQDFHFFLLCDGIQFGPIDHVPSAEDPYVHLIIILRKTRGGSGLDG